jgi:hypothetical protein
VGFRLVVLALRMLVRRLMMLMGGGLVGGSRMLMMLGGRMLGRLRHRRRSYSGYTVSEDSDRGLLQTLERKTFPPRQKDLGTAARMSPTGSPPTFPHEHG